MGGFFIKKNTQQNYIDELLNLKNEIQKLENDLKEKEFIVDRTREYLFILENKNELKDKQIHDLKVENESKIEEIIAKKEGQIKNLKEINEHEINCLNKNKFIFSIIILVFNAEKYLNQAIDSVLNQSFIFDNVEIILLDNECNDSSSEICRGYVDKYPDNIKYICPESQGLSVSRNIGLKVANGKFINFLDNRDELDPNTLNEIYYHFNKFGDEIDIISMAGICFDVSEGATSFFDKYTPSRIVDVNEEFDFSITSVNSAFIRRTAALNFEFDNRLVLSAEDNHFISQLILEKCKFAVVDSVKYLYRKRVGRKSLIDMKDDKYFNTCMEIHFKGLINYSIDKFGKVLKYIQSTLIYDLQRFYLDNTEVGVLNDDELNEFHSNIHDVLQYIEDEIIISQNFSKFIKGNMLNIKYNYPSLTIRNNLISLNDVSFDKLSDNKINLSIENSILKGYFKFYSKDIKINAMYDNEKLDVEIINVKEEILISHVISYEFNFIIKSENIVELNNISFELEFNSSKFPILTEFS